MDKLEMQSRNLVDENISKIAKLFPNCITEGKDENGQVEKRVDFDLLKQELSKDIVEGNDERYTLNWAGKKQAILTANSPINATLRPCREESVDFDNTKNLYIEGDNLDVLKLLRETYLGKVKMIYIDPPYNTGNDFVYEDDFATSAEEYLQASKSYDEQGNRMFQNSDNNGRFHSDWLSMMYSRLKVARDMLALDGLICISIDESEISNLRKVGDEIFGENNFINSIAVKMSTPSGVKLSHRDKKVLKIKEYICVYCKSKENVIINPQYSQKDEWDSYYEFYVDKIGNDCSNWKIYRLKDYLEQNGIHNTNINDPQFKKFYFENADKIWQRGRHHGIPKDVFEKSNIERDTVFCYNDKEDGLQYCYRGRRMAFLSKVMHDCVDGNGKIVKDMGTLLCDFWNDISTASLFAEGDVSFPNGKKPLLLLNRLIRMFSNESDIILDFFSGSGSTAHAVMQLNSFDHTNRKFIMVQIPEKCDENSDQYKDGFVNICELGKERIRRAGKKIIEEQAHLQNTYKETKLEPMKAYAEFTTSEKALKTQEEVKKRLDIGFRVLKLDSSNMKDVYYKPAELNQASLLDYVSNIKEDRTPEDLLFQVMLDMGVMLSSEIKTIDIKGKKVFNVNDGNLVCCFDNDLTDEVVTEIAKLQPLYAVFRDSSMSSDSVAVNFDQIFETYSPTTTRKVL